MFRKRAAGRSADAGEGTPAWHAWLVGEFSLLVFLLWWAGYYPGISTVDSMQAWEQGKAWIFENWHPVFHTWLIALAQRVWFTPAAVILVQIVALAAVLGSLNRRLSRANVAPRAAIAAPCLLALSPQTSFFSVVMWKDIPFAISVLWVFTEVLDLACDPERFLSRRRNIARLGASWLAVLLFRHNGILVAGIVILGVLIAYRQSWRKLMLGVLIAVVGTVGVRGPLYSYLDAKPTPVLFSLTTFVHDMAAFVNDHGSEMSTEDRAFLANILPLNRWKAPSATNLNGLYFCRQATPLIFPKEFYPPKRLDSNGRLVDSTSLPPVLLQNSTSVFLEQHQPEFRKMWLKFVMKWPGTFLGHRFCVGSLAWSPWHKTGLAIFAPPEKSTVNTPELQTKPLSEPINRFLSSVLKQWNKKEVRFLTWRSATWVYLSFAVIVIVSRRRKDKRFLVVGLPVFAAWFSVVTFTPGQSGRYTFPAYLCACASLALLIRRKEPSE